MFKKFEITPLGGVNVVGQNCFLYNTGKYGLVVDCGAMPPYSSYSPPDMAILDERMRNGVKMAAAITHGHLDHIGAIGELCQREIPIYLSQWSRNFVERNTKDLKGKFSIIPGKGNELTHGDLTVRFIPVEHSIPGTFGLLIRAGGKNILHLTDFKANGMDERTQQFEGVLWAIKQEVGTIHCLLLDVLNSELEGFTPPESLVIDELEKMMKEASGRLIISFFSSNLFRMKGIIEAASKLGKIVGFAGGMAISFRQIAKYLIEPALEASVQDCDVLFVGGSQGEDNSGLARIAMGEHPYIYLKSGDRVAIAARCIPGNEEGVRDVLTRLNGRKVPITLHLGERDKIGLKFPVEERLIHVSGHESRKGLRQVVNVSNPKIIVPIHTPEERVNLFEEMVGSTKIKRLGVGETLKI